MNCGILTFGYRGITRHCAALNDSITAQITKCHNAALGRLTWADPFRVGARERFSIMCSAGLQACCAADLKVCATESLPK